MGQRRGQIGAVAGEQVVEQVARTREEVVREISDGAGRQKLIVPPLRLQEGATESLVHALELPQPEVGAEPVVPSLGCCVLIGNVERVAQFIAICSSHILAETLCHSASFSGQSRGKRRTF